MTREEFMNQAEFQIDEAVNKFRNRMMNIVKAAWAEGKRNAEVKRVTDLVKEALENIGEIQADVTVTGQIEVESEDVPEMPEVPDIEEP